MQAEKSGPSDTDHQGSELYPRPRAAEYLSQKFGIRISKAALEQHASRGTGPAFRLALNQAVYSRAALDHWADALSPETPYSERRRKTA